MHRFSISGIAALAALLAACAKPAADSANQVANDAGNGVSLPQLPIAPATMDRAALLAAVAQAASAAAAGRDDGEVQAKLDGTPFEVRLRFGCSGPAEISAGDAMSWRFDAAKRTLRLHAAPDISIQQPLAAAVAGGKFEAAEGFWVARPWLLQPGCPAIPQPLVLPAPEKTGSADGSAPQEPKAAPPKAPSASAAVAETAPDPAGQRVGIVQFFTDTDSRTLRRDGRPYEATKSLSEGKAPSAQGYDLVLSGRLKRLPGGRVIACRVEQADRPPQCLVSADFDRVWIERPDSGESLAEWSAGG